MAPQVSENARVREFHRYYFALQPANTAPKSHNPQYPVSSHDSALTAFAQLAALRLNLRRCVISLFDSNAQYVIAEATQTLSLRSDRSYQSHDGLLLGISKQDRSLSPCAMVVDQNSYVSVPDLSLDTRFDSSPYRQGHLAVRFFAAVPIFTPAGILIGSYAVMDDEIHPLLDGAQVQFLKDMADTVAAHLSARRIEEEYRRGERGVRGMGSFAEGRASLRNWRPGLMVGERNQEESRRHLGGEGQLDSEQQATQQRQDRDHSNSDPKQSFDPATAPLPLSRPPTPPSEPSETLQESMLAPDVKSTFSRAANLLRESLEVQGALFLDASVATFGGLLPEDRDSRDSDATVTTSSTDSDLDTIGASRKNSKNPMHKMCEVLGFATTEMSSINGHLPHDATPRTPEHVLQSLLSRYPKGKIFRITDDGLSASSSSDDKDGKGRSSGGENSKSIDEKSGTPTSPKASARRRKKKGLPKHDTDIIVKMFSGARSLMFVPIWDNYRMRWFAGCFVWTNVDHRIFSNEGELGYISIFGSVLMAEVSRLDALKSDRAKSDLLGSISHELRSPLHGILGSVEMLGENKATSFQTEMFQTIASCGTTLLDTIDHLLDYTKINHSMHLNKHSNPLKGSDSQINTSLDRDGDGPCCFLGATTEEVVNVAIVGHDAQHRGQKVFTRTDMPDGSTELQLDNIVVILEIDPQLNRGLPIHRGAWKQILMNLFVNALKHTERGFIKVSVVLRQPTKKYSRQKVLLSVSDSGHGMSQEFIRDRLFTPFSQENHLTPGTGLGLSIVKGIVGSCGGKIDVQSTQDEGTKVSVSIPIKVGPVDKEVEVPSEEQKQLEKARSRASGMNYSIVGLGASEATSGSSSPQLFTTTKNASEHLRTSLERICVNWLGLEDHTTMEENNAADIQVVVETPENSAQIKSGELLAQFRTSTRLQGQRPQFVLVLCQSSASARAMPAHIPKETLSNLTIGYTSQPCGPHKLAKALLTCLDLQHKPISSSEQKRLDLPVLPSPPFSLSLSENGPTQEFSPPQTPPASALDAATLNRPSSLSRASSPRPPLASSSPSFSSPTPAGKLASFGPFLIVDDNRVNLRVLGTYLAKRDISYQTVANGAEALECFKADPTKCRTIIMDVQMPVMDGLESARRIRKHEKEMRLAHHGMEFKDEPTTIVMLTGLGSANVRVEAFASGADGFWMKPLVLKKIEKGLQTLSEARMAGRAADTVEEQVD